jgi:guanylate kinase
MEEQIDAGSFIEYANVHGNLYGTSFESLLNISGDKQCLLDIDVEGVRSIKEFQSTQKQQQVMNESSTQQYPLLDSKFVFIAPPSVDVLRERLAGRGTETPETIERRFQNAKAELEYGMEPGNFDAIVVNDDLDKSCEEFESIVKEMYSRRTAI